jgi:predicted Zn-dependent peptidase
VASSHFALYALTSSQYMEDTRAALASELTRLQTQVVPKDELLRAKAYLKGRYLLAHQYSSQYAFDLAWYELQGLGTQYDAIYPAAIDRVTAEDLQRVARDYFTHYILTVVMPLSMKDAVLPGRGLSALPARVHQEQRTEATTPGSGNAFAGLISR